MDGFSAPLRKKLVIVGDGACGKTSLLMYLPLASPDSAPVCGEAMIHTQSTHITSKSIKKLR
jgi:GTPase SAR1 family protein